MEGQYTLPEALTLIGQEENRNRFLDTFAGERELLLEHQIEITPTRAAQVTQMTEAINMFLADLGVEKVFKAPALDQIHFYNPNDFNSVSNKLGLVAENGKGALVTLGDIIVSDGGNSEETLYIFNHENIHFDSAATIDVQTQTDQKLAIKHFLGLRRSDRGFNILNEAITEITNVALIKEYWRKQPDLRGIEASLNPLGYAPYVDFFKRLIEQVANKMGLSYETVLKRLQLQMFAGKGDALGLIVATFGNERTEKIAHLPKNQIELERLERKLFKEK